MKVKLIGFSRLIFGFILCALGLVLMINSNLGLSPWETLNQGISKIVGITMGQSSILVSIFVVILDVLLGENIGWGTILNMTIIGVFIDIFMLNNLVPVSTSFIPGIVSLFLGMIIMSVGCYLYIGVAIGSGARDGMMVAIQKRTNKPIRLVRSMIEVVVLIIGFLLGGTIGIGTIITSLGLGHCIQFVFKVFKFDVSSVKHRYIIDDINDFKLSMKGKVANKKES